MQKKREKVQRSVKAELTSQQYQVSRNRGDSEGRGRGRAGRKEGKEGRKKGGRGRMERGRDGGKEGRREWRKEGEREGTEGVRNGMRERRGGKEGGREGGKEGGRKGGEGRKGNDRSGEVGRGRVLAIYVHDTYCTFLQSYNVTMLHKMRSNTDVLLGKRALVS